MVYNIGSIRFSSKLRLLVYNENIIIKACF